MGLQVFVTDMNVGFSQKGPMASPRINSLVAPMAEFLRGLPLGSRVVFVSDCHKPGDAEWRRFEKHCEQGSGEEKVRQELIAACEDAGVEYVIIYKSEHDVFAGTELPSNACHPYRLSACPQLVQEHIVESDADWIVIGCVTDICVDANVGSLVQHGKRVTVVRNLIDTYDLPLDTCRKLGLPDAAVHDAETINDFWFGHRFPVTWGAKVVDDWKELL